MPDAFGGLVPQGDAWAAWPVQPSTVGLAPGDKPAGVLTVNRVSTRRASSSCRMPKSAL